MQPKTVRELLTKLHGKFISGDILKNMKENESPLDLKQFRIKKELEFDFNSDIKIELDNGCIIDLNNRQMAPVFYNTLFKEYPSSYGISEISYNDEILDFLKEKTTLLYRSITDNHISYMFLYEDIIITCNNNITLPNKVLINFYFSSKKKFTMPFDLNEFFTQENKSYVSILKKNAYGDICVDKMDLCVTTEFLPELNYNDDFIQFDSNVIDFLEKKDSGLILLHGVPGSGKSMFCKHLIKRVDREFIFIPPSMVGLLSSPEFADELTTSHKGSVLIIEDAEKALMKRESMDGFHNSEVVSSLLNLTDGIFADLTKIAIICTYNCDRNLIDPALLRKGRLKAEYEFKKLTIEKTQNLLDHLKIDHQTKEEMTVADIYNFEQQVSTVDRQPRRIGFAS